MLNYRKNGRACPAADCGAVRVGDLVLAADASKAPSVTVTIDETQFGFIIGGSAGGGD